MDTKKIIIGLMLAMLAFPAAVSAQDQPPGLPAVDFGDEEVPEFETEQQEEQQEEPEEEIEEPPTLIIDPGPTIIVDPEPNPAPQEPQPTPQELPDTGSPALLLSFLPALGYTITKRLNK